MVQAIILQTLEEATASDADIGDGEWYIDAVTDTDANLVAGNITATGTYGSSSSPQVVTIANATLLQGGLTGQNESITWSIKEEIYGGSYTY